MTPHPQLKSMAGVSASCPKYFCQLPLLGGIILLAVFSRCEATPAYTCVISAEAKWPLAGLAAYKAGSD
jgi:hypothetical protein